MQRNISCVSLTETSLTGLVDTTSIPIKQPLDFLPEYTDRKMRTAVKLQLACDSRKKILHLSAGWPASMHDALIYQLSSLPELLKRVIGEEGYFALLDKAYRLTRHCMTPYRRTRTRPLNEV